MAYPETRGQPGKTENLGKIAYAGDNTQFYPLLANTAGGGGSGRLVVAQREPFLAWLGPSALSGGMVAAGSITGSGTTVSGAADTTVWGTTVTYAPLRSGQIDGLATGGVVYGSLTIGLKVAGTAGTIDAKVTARIKNNANTTWTTALTLTGVIGCTTAEVYKTYDIPALLTDANFNAIPFDFAIGHQSASAATTVNARIISTSFIIGDFEPNT